MHCLLKILMSCKWTMPRVLWTNVARCLYYFKRIKISSLLRSRVDCVLNWLCPWCRPLTVLNFRWSRIIEGSLHPMAFHLQNAILHSVVTVLFYMLTQSLFETTSRIRWARLLLVVEIVIVDSSRVAFGHRDILPIHDLLVVSRRRWFKSRWELRCCSVIHGTHVAAVFCCVSQLHVDDMFDYHND